MKFVLFYHSLVSDWNHGNAHFLRGIATELLARGHRVDLYEPADGWSLSNLLRDCGPVAVEAFRSAYPQLTSKFYSPQTFDLDRALDGSDVVIVHEWNDPQWISRIGKHAARLGCRAVFHDTHHRCVTAPWEMAAIDLRHYDGVLAFGQAVAQRYLRMGWAQSAWVWHEAADTRRFYRRPGLASEGDLVWIGNWGDEERSAELREFLLAPARALHLKTKIHGVRYPQEALAELQAAGIQYGGWLANYRVPEVLASYRCTVHVPRRAYARALPGIPTIRMFEALACGIPLVSAPWEDAENLFRPGVDYLMAADAAEMREHLRAVLADRDLASSLAAHGRQTIEQRHTCAHRVDELLQIVATLKGASAAATMRKLAKGR